MAAENKNEESGLLGANIDFYNMGKDILKNLKIILILSVTIALLAGTYVMRSYYPTYTVEATYVITTKGSENNAWSNLSTAIETATRFTQILNSSTLRNKVAEDLGTGGVPGTVSASVVDETNLMTLRVRSSSPRMSFLILKSVMKNYPLLADYLVSDAVLEVLVPPSIPEGPDSTVDVAGTMIKVLLISFIALIAIFGMISYLQDTVRASIDVEKKLDTKLLGTFPHEDLRVGFLAKLRGRKRSLLITNKTISFQYVELVKKACRRIQSKLEREDKKVLLVTSCLENEGKSSVAANLALSLAQNGKKVVLIDADFRKPAQYKIFGQKKVKLTEFSEAMKGNGSPTKVVRKLDKFGIYSVFNSRAFSSSIDLLTSDAMKQLLDYLRRNFDFVVIDAPPMSIAADAEELANLADASVLVVREHKAHAKDINEVIDTLNSFGSELMGCIFNDAHNVSGTGYGYGYGGGYGYGYGYGYGKNYGYGYGQTQQSTKKRS